MTFRAFRYKRWTGKLRRSEKGQSLVELALTLPVLVLFLVGAAEFAEVAYVAIEVANAAKAGVAYGSQSVTATGAASDIGGIQNAATLDANNVTMSTPTVTVTGVCSSGAACTGAGNTCKNTDCTTNAGDHIETIVSVDTTGAFTPSIHLPGLPTSFTLHGHATQICLP